MIQACGRRQAAPPQRPTLLMETGQWPLWRVMDTRGIESRVLDVIMVKWESGTLNLDGGPEVLQADGDGGFVMWDAR